MTKSFRQQLAEVLQLSGMLGDEEKAIAEYWMDGPGSETPPGHWNLLAHGISWRDQHTLDEDVKMFFALNAALFDAGISAWDAKRAYDCVRPISAIHTSVWSPATVEVSSVFCAALRTSNGRWLRAARWKTVPSTTTRPASSAFLSPPTTPA